MSHSLRLPDEVYRLLAAYAEGHQQTPEETVAALVRALLQPERAEAEPPLQSNDDPWDGLYGKFTADAPDVTLNHDQYLAEAYEESHDEDA